MTYAYDLRSDLHCSLTLISCSCRSVVD